MAKLNHVELSPSPATAEDEVEAGSDDERAADVINKSLRTSSTRTPAAQQPNSPLQFLKYFKAEGQPSTQNVGDFFFPPDKSTSEKGQDLVDPDELADIQIEKQLANHGRSGIEASRSPSTDLKDPSNIKKRKDIYELESDAENLAQGGEAEESAHRPTTRGHKAKAAAERRSAERTFTSQRQTRAKARAVAKEPPKESKKGQGRLRGAAKNPDTPSEPSTKRRRGRPTKSELVLPEVIPEEPIREDEEITDEGENVQSRGEGDGTSGLFMNPSPVKPIIPTPPRLKSKQQSLHARPVNGASPSSTAHLYSVSDDTDHSDEDSNKEADYAKQSTELSTTLKDILSTRTFNRMLKNVQQVGQKQNKETKEWVDVPEVKPRLQSIPAENMLQSLKVLNKIYSVLPRLSGTEDESAKLNQDIAHKEVERLLEESEVIFKERLGNKADITPQQDTKRVQGMLSDIYFLLVPNIVKVLKSAVKAYQDEEIAETATTKQVIDILDLLRRLGERAISQPKDVQPKNDRYRTSAPTRSIVPETRTLLKNWRTELRRAELMRKAEKWNAGAAERERQRVAREEQAIGQRERERSQRHQQHANEFRSKLEDPGLYGHLLRKELGVSQSDRKQRPGLNRSSAYNYRGDDGDTSAEDDPFDERDESVSRMTPLFINSSGRSRPSLGKKSNKHHGPRPFGLREKQIVTNTLRLEDRSYRYQLAAERIGRDMEEIIAFAKVFQESMDRQHEIGKWNREEDAWTYDIWVEKA